MSSGREGQRLRVGEHEAHACVIDVVTRVVDVVRRGVDAGDADAGNIERRTGQRTGARADASQLVASRILIAKTSESPGWIPARG